VSLATLGPVQQTAYWLIAADDARYAGLAADTPLRDDRTGATLATVPARYAADLAMEGSGRLADGRVVNYSGGPTTAPRVHVEPASKPWGSTASGRAAVPLRTMAVDRALVPLGSRVYVRELDGWAVPAVGGAGGFVHDGWFSADDTGGAIVGQHVDLFCGPRAMHAVLRGRLPSGARIVLAVDASTAGRGAGYRPPPAPPGTPGGAPALALALGIAGGVAAGVYRLAVGRWPWEGWA
jgi:3D (Asp-Asp-Asp) domain-containing protein